MRTVFKGDFNVNLSHSSMKEFCDLNGFKNLINEMTCYKNSEKPTCIDLILTNQLLQHYFNIVLLFLRLDSLIFIYSQSLNLKRASKNASPILLLTGTTKTITMMNLDLKFKAFVF